MAGRRVRCGKALALFYVPRMKGGYLEACWPGLGGVGWTIRPDEKLVDSDFSPLEEDDLPELNVEHDLLNKLKGRVQLARKIDTATHRDKKETHDKNWMRVTAEAMLIELASDFECVLCFLGSSRPLNSQFI